MPSQTETTKVGVLVALIILSYDHLLTFPAEVHHFWRPPRYNLGVLLFFTNRYFGLCLHVFNVTRVFAKAWLDRDKACVTMETTERAGIIVSQLFCAVIMAMRVYALYEKNRIILASLIVVAMGILCFSFWAFFFNPFKVKGTSYVCYVDTSSALHMAILWSGQLVFDAVTFVLTSWKSYCLGKAGDRSLMDVLLRDGAIYFALISGVNVANIAVLLLVTVNYKSVSGIFTNSVNVIMISRLVLNLQEASHRGSTEDTDYSLMPMTTVVRVDDVSMRADDA